MVGRPGKQTGNKDHKLCEGWPALRLRKQWEQTEVFVNQNLEGVLRTGLSGLSRARWLLQVHLRDARGVVSKAQKPLKLLLNPSEDAWMKLTRAGSKQQVSLWGLQLAPSSSTAPLGDLSGDQLAEEMTGVQSPGLVIQSRQFEGEIVYLTNTHSP